MATNNNSYQLGEFNSVHGHESVALMRSAFRKPLTRMESGEMHELRKRIDIGRGSLLINYFVPGHLKLMQNSMVLCVYDIKYDDNFVAVTCVHRQMDYLEKMYVNYYVRTLSLEGFEEDYLWEQDPANQRPESEFMDFEAERLERERLMSSNEDDKSILSSSDADDQVCVNVGDVNSSSSESKLSTLSFAVDSGHQCNPNYCCEIYKGDLRWGCIPYRSEEVAQFMEQMDVFVDAPEVKSGFLDPMAEGPIGLKGSRQGGYSMYVGSNVTIGMTEEPWNFAAMRVSAFRGARGCLLNGNTFIGLSVGRSAFWYRAKYDVVYVDRLLLPAASGQPKTSEPIKAVRRAMALGDAFIVFTYVAARVRMGWTVQQVTEGKSIDLSGKVLTEAARRFFSVEDAAFLHSGFDCRNSFRWYVARLLKQSEEVAVELLMKVFPHWWGTSLVSVDWEAYVDDFRVNFRENLKDCSFSSDLSRMWFFGAMSILGDSLMLYWLYLRLEAVRGFSVKDMQDARSYLLSNRFLAVVALQSEFGTGEVHALADKVEAYSAVLWLQLGYDKFDEICWTMLKSNPSFEWFLGDLYAGRNDKQGGFDCEFD